MPTLRLGIDPGVPSILRRLRWSERRSVRLQRSRGMRLPAIDESLQMTVGMFCR